MLGLLVGNGEQHSLHTAHAQYIAERDGGSCGISGGAVYRDAAFRAQVVYCPAIILAADEGGVLPGDHRIVEHYVTASRSAQDVFPVGQRLTGSVGQGQIGPDLRLWGGIDEGANDPYQHGQSQQGEEKAQNQGVPGEGLGIVRRQLPQGKNSGLETVEKLGQVHPSFQNGRKGLLTGYYISTADTRAVLHKHGLICGKSRESRQKTGAATEVCCCTGGG